MYAVWFFLQFIRVIVLMSIICFITSCVSGNHEPTRTREVCLEGANCKSFSVKAFDRHIFNHNLLDFHNEYSSWFTTDTDLQDVFMYNRNRNCKQCKDKQDKTNNRMFNVYLGMKKDTNGLPLNNIELNAVLREYNGNQVNGFCNHVVSIINPVKKFLTKQKFVIKDSIKRNGKIVM